MSSAFFVAKLAPPKQTTSQPIDVNSFDKDSTPTTPSTVAASATPATQKPPQSTSQAASGRAFRGAYKYIEPRAALTAGALVIPVGGERHV